MSKQQTSPSPELKTNSTLPFGGQVEPQEDSAAPAPLRRTLALTGLALVASTVLTGSIGSSHHERFPSHLSADKQVILAPKSGSIESLAVKPGQIVVPGNVLFRIVNRNAEGKRGDLEQAVLRLEQELSSAQARAEVETSSSIDNLEAQVFAAENQLAEHLASKYLESVRAKAWGDFGSLFDSLASSKSDRLDIRPLTRDLQDPSHQIEAMLKEAEAENKAEALQTRIELSENRLKALRQRAKDLPRQHAVAAKVPQIEKRLADARQRLADYEEPAAEDITTPVFGMAGNINRNIQDEVKAGELLVEIFDRDHEFLTATLPAKYAANLKPGSIVKIHFSEGVREGTIEAVPPQAKTNSKGEAEVDVRILPTGKVWPFMPIGSTVEISLN